MDNDLDKEEIGLRLTALDRAISSGVGNEIDVNTAFTKVNEDKIIEAAKKFEVYLKGTNNVWAY